MKYYFVFLMAAITIPIFLGINAWQSTECTKLRNEIKIIEKDQENFVNENKTVANEIVKLLSTERIESEARRMGLHKMYPEDVILVIMGGRERGNQ